MKRKIKVAAFFVFLCVLLVPILNASAQTPQEKEQIGFKLANGTSTYYLTTEKESGGVQAFSGLTSSNSIRWDYDKKYYGPIITDKQGNYYFCIEVKKQAPTGQEYQQTELTDKRYQALLAHGYPNNVSGLLQKYPRSEEQALLSVYIAANTISGGYTESVVRSKGDQYVNALLDLAQAQDVPKYSLKVSKDNLQGEYNPVTNRLETQFIEAQGSNTTFALKGLPAGTYAVGEDNKKITGKIKTGEKFKIVSEDLTLENSFSISIVDHGLSNQTYFKFIPPTSNLQTVISGPCNTCPIQVAPFSIKFNKATGAAAIAKTSEDGVIEGLTFRIKGIEEKTKTFDKVVKTDKDGKFLETGLVPGKYSVAEEVTPDRYIIPQVQVIEVQPGKVETVTFSNKIKKGKIELYKTQFINNKEEGAPLKGVEFTIYEYNPETKEKGKEVQKLVTNEKGYAISQELLYGDYILVETKPLSGYYKLEKDFIFSIKDNNELITYRVSNVKEPEKEKEVVYKPTIYTPNTSDNNLKEYYIVVCSFTGLLISLALRKKLKRKEK